MSGEKSFGTGRVLHTVHRISMQSLECSEREPWSRTLTRDWSSVAHPAARLMQVHGNTRWVCPWCRLAFADASAPRLGAS